MCGECVVKHGGRPMCEECVSQLTYERKPREEREVVEAPVVKEPPRPVKKAAAKKTAAPRKKVFAETDAWKTPEKPTEAAPGFKDIILGREPRRVVAKLIDFVIVTLFALPLSYGLDILTAKMFKEVRGIGYELCFYVMLVLFSYLYFVIAEWRFGKTIGKWLLSLQVVKKDGSPGIGLFQAYWRWTGFMAGLLWSLAGWWIGSHITGVFVFMLNKTGVKVPQFLPVLVLFVSIAIFTVFSLGLLITFIGKYKRGFHDILGDTAVIMIKK